jgi:hypothetical protein
MLWVTTQDIEIALAEAGFIEPRVTGGFVWIWREHHDMRAWGYSANFAASRQSAGAVRARLLRTLSRLGEVELIWVDNDEADFYFVSDVIEVYAESASDDEDDESIAIHIDDYRKMM